MAATALAAGEVIHEGAFLPSDLQWTHDKSGGVTADMEGLRTLAEPGQPQLPVRDLTFLVPIDRDVARAWIEPLATHREAAPAALKPAEPLVSESGVFITEGVLETGGKTFPADWGRFTGTHVWRGYRLMTITVHPVRSVTGTDQLEFLDNFAVRVEYTDPRPGEDIAVRERLVPGEAERNGARLSGLVANPEVISGYRREHGVFVEKAAGGFSPDKTPSISGSPVDYLIITNEAMAPSFQVMADHKTAQGIATVVVTREYIAANFRNGADIQETMRMFIRDAYQKWGTEYVLLGGDSDILPPRYINNTFYPTNGSTDIPVDLYFACLDGNWNDNGNASYGEPVNNGYAGDLADFAEEVYIGRAPVSTPAVADVFVNKVITYETVAQGEQWTNRALFAAEVLFPDDFDVQQYIILDGAAFADQQVTNYIEPCTDMEYMRMYETDMENPSDATLTRAALIDTLNSGRYGILNQIGHGYYFNMSVGDANFMTTDADALTNGDHLFMIYALNCASAAFDNSCLMERFIQNPNGGAVCAVGSVRAAFPNNANNYQQLFFQALYCAPVTRVGELIALSRAPYLGLTAENYVDRWTFENYTLLGDPSLSLWTGSPRTVAVSAPAGLGLGPQNVAVNVTVDGAPVFGLEVCLSKDGDDYVHLPTDINGDVSLPFLPTSDGIATLTVTGKNLEMTQIDIPVAAGSAYVALETMNLADDGSGASAGNGDGFVDAGETIELYPILRETGGAGTGALSGVLSSADPGVTVTTGAGTFPAVGAGGTTAVDAPFVVTIDPTVADGTPVTFEIYATDGVGDYHSEWDVIVRAPEIEVVSLDWEDTTYGNGNGLVDEGERFNIFVDVKNFGAGTSSVLDGRLRTDNPSIALHDTMTTWPELSLLQTGSSTLTLSLTIQDMLATDGAYLVVSDAHGRSVRHDFSLPRPSVPTDIVTDTSLGADVIALTWTPSVSPDVYGYNILRSQTPGGPFTRVNEDVVAGTSYYRDEGLTLLTQYYYQVEAVNASMISSPVSAVVSQATAPPESANFPVAFSDETSSPLAVGDVDGDGDLEIVLASSQVYVWHHDGLELKDGDGDSQTLGVFTDYAIGTVLQPSGVTLANLDGVAGAEMIISERTPAQQIHVLNKDGDEIPGWPRSLVGPAGTRWNWAAPAVGDIDGDGDEEIVVNSLNGVVWAWHHDGAEVLDGDANPATVGVFHDRDGADWEWSRSGPTLVDLDNDGAKDIVFGTKNDATGQRRLMAFKHDGTFVAGFPYIGIGAINCNIAAGDLDNDGVMELVFYDKSRYVHVVREDGTNYPGFPHRTDYVASDSWVTSPALSDMDGDGQLEIIYAPNENGLLSRLVVIDTDHVGGTSGTLKTGWPVTLPGSSEGSPVVGDIDGDGSPEVVHGIGGGNESAPYNLYAYHADGTSVAGFPITLTGPLMPSAVITDLDRDWDVDIVYGGWDFLVHVWDMPFAYDRNNVQWPTHKGGIKRDGVILPLELVGVEDRPDVPAVPMLVEQPYPNPFNPSTTIRLYVSGGGTVDVEVFDLQGRRVRTLHNGPMATGWHDLIWDGRDDGGRGQSSGMYFVRARGAGEVSVQKMTLVK